MEWLESLVVRIPRWGAETLINMGLPLGKNTELGYADGRVILKDCDWIASFDKKGNFYINGRRVTPRYFRNWCVLGTTYTSSFIKRINNILPLDVITAEIAQSPRIKYGRWIIENIESIKFSWLCPYAFDFTPAGGAVIPKDVMVITSGKDEYNGEAVIVKSGNFSVVAEYSEDDNEEQPSPLMVYRGAKWGYTGVWDNEPYDFMNCVVDTSLCAIESGRQILREIITERVGEFMMASSEYVDTPLFVTKNAIIVAKTYEEAMKLYSSANKDLLIDGWVYVHNMGGDYYRNRFGVLKTVVVGDSNTAKIITLTGLNLDVPYTHLIYMKSLYDVIRAVVYF